MSMPTQWHFRTKTGECTITSERIILQRSGLLGAAAKQIHGNDIRRTLAIYALVGILAVVMAAKSLTDGSYLLGGFIGIAGLLLLWSVLSSRYNSGTPVVERSTIKSVVAHPPRPPVARGYFVVTFLENGRERRRLIMLPGSLSGGKEAWKQALVAMRESGLMTRTTDDGTGPSV